jgi:hypothetical protein
MLVQAEDVAVHVLGQPQDLTGAESARAALHRSTIDVRSVGRVQVLDVKVATLVPVEAGVPARYLLRRAGVGMGMKLRG